MSSCAAWSNRRPRATSSSPSRRPDSGLLRRRRRTSRPSTPFTRWRPSSVTSSRRPRCESRRSARAPCRPPSWSRSANSTGRRRRMGPCPRTAASTPSAGRSPPRSSPRRWRTPSAPRDSTCSPTPSTAASTRSTSARCSTSGRRRSPSARCWYRSTGCWRRSSPRQQATSPPASARTPGKATPSPPDWLACHSPTAGLRSAVCARRRNRGARRRPRRGALAGNRAGFGRGGRNRCRRFHRGFGRHMDGGVDQPARGGDALRRAR